MSNDTTQSQTPDMMAALAALLAQTQAKPAAPAVGGWNQPALSATPANVLGVSVPIKLQTPMGSVRVYLAFGPEHASTPAALNALIEQLANAGLPLDAWTPSQGQSNSWGGANKFTRRY